MQGWTILGPTETAPIAEIWAEQLDRAKAPATKEFYDTLTNKAIDMRIAYLKQGKQMPPFTIELLLVALDELRQTERETEWERYKRLNGTN